MNAQMKEQERGVESIVPSRVTSDGAGVRIHAHAASRLLLVAGRPLGEPIAQYGPFVMNNEEQLQQAMEDYRAGRLA